MADNEKENICIKPIAQIESDFKTKFGLPRQAGLSMDISSKVVFNKEYSVKEAFRGLEGYSHIWLIWGFSLFEGSGEWSPTVRPPRLGGNKRVGVFATRSPNRPNPLALSCVSLEKIAYENGRMTLYIKGADMANGTPVYDVKPYLAFADSFPNAKGGFADEVAKDKLEVEFANEAKQKLNEEQIRTLQSILSQDPRPHYQDDFERIYKFEYGQFEISFRVDKGVLYVIDIKNAK